MKRPPTQDHNKKTAKTITKQDRQHDHNTRRQHKTATQDRQHDHKTRPPRPRPRPFKNLLMIF